jgi:hypothetical protein
MLLPYFQTENNLGAVITPDSVVPTLAMWRIIQGADRILMTDCADHAVCTMYGKLCLVHVT